MKIIDERNGKQKHFAELPLGAVFEAENNIYIKCHEYNRDILDSLCINKGMTTADFDDSDRVFELNTELHILEGKNDG